MKSKMPLKIRQVIEQVGKEHGEGYVTAKRINGKYYVYVDKVVWDKEKGRTRTISKYLGRVDDDIFIPKRISDLEKAESIIREHGGRVVFNNDAEQYQNNVLQIPTEVEAKILMILSMNARANLSRWAENLGMEKSTLYHKVKHLEAKYGITYIPEIDFEKLGFQIYLFKMKFLDVIPGVPLLKEVMLSEPHVQVAFLVKGDYDLGAFILAESNLQLEDIIGSIRNKLMDYVSEARTTPAYTRNRLIPIRDEFFSVLEEKVWQKSKSNPHPSANQLLNREFIVLRELNKNGVEEFSKIDSKFGFASGQAQYSYHKLLSKGIIRRISMNMQKAIPSFIAEITKEIQDRKKFILNREQSMIEINEKKNMIDKYLYSADISAPNGSIAYLPIFGNDELQDTLATLVKLDLGRKYTTNIILDILAGNFCQRNFDVAYTTQQEVLESEYKHKHVKKEEY